MVRIDAPKWHDNVILTWAERGAQSTERMAPRYHLPALSRSFHGELRGKHGGGRRVQSAKRGEGRGKGYGISGYPHL